MRSAAPSLSPLSLGEPHGVYGPRQGARELRCLFPGRHTSGSSRHHLRIRTWVTASNHRRITAPHTRTFNHGAALGRGTDLLPDRRHRRRRRPSGGGHCQAAGQAAAGGRGLHRLPAEHLRLDARLRLQRPFRRKPVRRRVDAAHVDRGARGRRGGACGRTLTLRSVFGRLARVGDLWAALRTAAPTRIEAAFAYGE